ncbi:hypothetical protein ACLOJK_003131 [Asimina triloba]
MGFTFLSLRSNPSPSPHLRKLVHVFQPAFPQNPRLPHVSTRPPCLPGIFTVSASRPLLPRQLLFLRKPAFRTRASDSEPRPPDDRDGRVNGKIIIASAITIALAVLNRVLYKLALVPMKEYPFFMAQFTTFGYVAIYFSILYLRRHAGIVTKEMLRLPKSNFMSIGALEALGLAAGMSAGGPAIPLLSQVTDITELKLLETVTLADMVYFNAKGENIQVSSWLHVVDLVKLVTVCMFSNCSGSNDTQLLSQMEFLWPALMIASSAFQAAASIIKEFVFIDAEKQLEGKPLDIFVVNSFGSGFQAPVKSTSLNYNAFTNSSHHELCTLLVRLLMHQVGPAFLPDYVPGCLFAFPSDASPASHCHANSVNALFVFLLLPFLSNLKGIPFSELPSYIRSGAGCEGAPLLPLLYMFLNMAFNISVLYLVKISSAVVSSLAATLSVPISIYLLTLPLPYYTQGDSLGPYFALGAAILVSGRQVGGDLLAEHGTFEDLKVDMVGSPITFGRKLLVLVS